MPSHTAYCCTRHLPYTMYQQDVDIALVHVLVARGSSHTAAHSPVHRQKNTYLISPVTADHAGEEGRNGPEQHADLKKVRRVPQQPSQHR